MYLSVGTVCWRSFYGESNDTLWEITAEWRERYGLEHRRLFQLRTPRCRSLSISISLEIWYRSICRRLEVISLHSPNARFRSLYPCSFSHNISYWTRSTEGLRLPEDLLRSRCGLYLPSNLCLTLWLTFFHSNSKTNQSQVLSRRVIIDLPDEVPWSGVNQEGILVHRAKRDEDGEIHYQNLSMWHHSQSWVFSGKKKKKGKQITLF